MDFDIRNPLQTKRIFDQKGTTWSVGASVVAGTEWFATKRFSLHAEYGLSARYVWEETSETMRKASNSFDDYKNEKHSKGWELAARSVKFGLSVYF
jgi:hypothetical protein